MVLRIRAVAFTALLAFALVAGLFASSSPARAQDSSVSIVDFAFSSATITVEVGSTVTWSNDGAATHTVTGDGGEFDSGDLATGETYSVTFDTPGTYGYHCEIHPDMVGTVIVVDSSDDDGADTTDDTSDDTSLPTTGTGPLPAGQQANLFLLLLSIAAFAGATMFRRATRR